MFLADKISPILTLNKYPCEVKNIYYESVNVGKLF